MMNRIFLWGIKGNKSKYNRTYDHTLLYAEFRPECLCILVQYADLPDDALLLDHLYLPPY